MIDWSYELLPEGERAVFARMCAFIGGLDLEAAESVIGGHGIDSNDVLDLIDELVDKSLVVVEERSSSNHALQAARNHASIRPRATGSAG